MPWLSILLSILAALTGGGYDDEDRLTAWERDDSALDQSWTLSAVGDWDTFTQNGTPVSRTHGNTHELTAIGGTSLSYDAKGNLTGDHQSRGYAWDKDNLLSSTTKSGTTVSYAYDAFGRRVSRTAGGVTTAYVSNGYKVLSEYTSGTSGSSPLRKYVNGSSVDEPVLLIDRTAAGATGAGTDERLYYHRNEQGSITALTDNGGTVVERYAYTAYGNPTILDGAGTTPRTASSYGNPYAYTAREHEPDSLIKPGMSGGRVVVSTPQRKSSQSQCFRKELVISETVLPWTFGTEALLSQ